MRQTRQILCRLSALRYQAGFIDNDWTVNSAAEAAANEQHTVISILAEIVQDSCLFWAIAAGQQTISLFYTESK